MTESTINKVFTSRDWFESDCDTCADRKSVALLADERVCYDCLLKHYDEQGNAFDQSEAFGSIYEEQAKKLAYKQLLAQVAAFLLGMLFAGVVIGHLADYGLTVATAVYGGGR